MEETITQITEEVKKETPEIQEDLSNIKDERGRFKPGFSGNPGGKPKGGAEADRVLLKEVKNLALAHILKVMEGDDEKRKDKFAEALIKLMPKETVEELEENQIYVIRKP